MHCGTSRQVFEKFPCADNRLETRAKGVERPRLIGIGKIRRQLAADHALDGLDHFGKPLAHVGAVGVLDRRRHAQFADDLGEHGIGQYLAVREDAVKVKNDGAVLSAQRRAQLRNQFPGVQGW